MTTYSFRSRGFRPGSTPTTYGTRTVSVTTGMTSVISPAAGASGTSRRAAAALTSAVGTPLDAWSISAVAVATGATAWAESRTSTSPTAPARRAAKVAVCAGPRHSPGGSRRTGMRPRMAAVSLKSFMRRPDP